MRKIIVGLILLSVLLTIGCQRKRLYSKEEGQTYAKKRVEELLADSIYAYSLNQKLLIDNEELAIKIVEPILFEKFGEDQIKKERPYQAFKVNDHWLVKGSAPDNPDFRGGVFEIVIDSRDARVIRLTHGK